MAGKYVRQPERVKICSKCGLDWNVSIYSPNTEPYVCPWCYYGKSKEKADNRP